MLEQLAGAAKKLCAPSLVYLVLSGLTLVWMVLSFSFVFHPIDFLGKTAWTGLWTYALDLICKRGYEGLAWLLVFLPFIIGGIVLFAVGGSLYELVREKREDTLN
jgi:hypothetical protein